MLLRAIHAVFLLILLSAARLSAQPVMSLSDALRSRRVQVAVESLGGYQGRCIRLLVRNLTAEALTVEAGAGLIFDSRDSSVQNLMSTSSELLALQPGQTRPADLYTMCIQSFNAGPAKGEGYSFGGAAEGPLLKLARQIAGGGYQNSTAQSAVWALTNRESVGFVYGEDTSMVRQLARTLSEATGTPMSQFIFTPRPHSITTIRTSFECLSGEALSGVSLGLYDSAGRQIRSYFTNRSLEPGFHAWRLGASHTLGASAKLSLRLLAGGRLIAERPVLASDTVARLQRYDSEAVLIYEAGRDYAGQAGVYDAQGRLYFLLAPHLRIPKGLHRSQYLIGKDLPPGQAYYVRVVADGQVLAETVLDPDAPAPQVYPIRRVQGEFAFRQDSVQRGLRLAIYDSKGRLKRVLYDIAVLNPGPKRYTYSFEHNEGPGARFYIRLTGPGQLVLREEAIVDK
jgi:hypothetical protein